MTPKDLHKILDAELSKARNRRVKSEQTNATIKVINAKLAYVRLQYQVMKDSGVPQDFGGLLAFRAPIEGKAKRVEAKGKVLALKRA